MQDVQLAILSSKDLDLLAMKVADLIAMKLKAPDADEYRTPKQLAELIPVLSAYQIARDIRANKYGKKFGPKGKLMAKVSEVKKINRI